MWDYPRPPIVVPSSERVRVVHHDVVIADSVRALRVLETSQAPAYYVPRDDIRVEHLFRTKHRTFCEWKGAASYFAVQVGDDVVYDAAWSYETPSKGFEAIAHHVAFYAQRVDECWVDDERVEPNAGGFYGGWVTSKVVGPFKGAPGTETW